MIIQPGVEQPSVANMIEIIRTDARRRVNVVIYDDNGNPTDILEEKFSSGEGKGELDLEITDVRGSSIYQEVYWPNTNPGRISHNSDGKYSILFGTENNETTNIGTILFNWHARIDETQEDMYRTQVLEITTPRVLSILPKLRFMIDKTIKPVVPEEYCFIGFTDGQLLMCLQLGLHMINQYEPYPCWNDINSFPIEHYSDILIKAAIYEGVTSQTLFSIDTDIPSFSDQGHSFVLQHATPLAGYLNSLRAELDKIIPIFKLKFVNSGTAAIEVNMSQIYYSMLASAPSGSLFRNYVVT